MHRYQPADQIINGLQTYGIVDMRSNQIHDEFWYCQAHRDAALIDLNKAHKHRPFADRLFEDWLFETWGGFAVRTAVSTILSVAIVYGSWKPSCPQQLSLRQTGPRSTTTSPIPINNLTP